MQLQECATLKTVLVPKIQSTESEKDIKNALAKWEIDKRNSL